MARSGSTGNQTRSLLPDDVPPRDYVSALAAEIDDSLDADDTSISVIPPGPTGWVPFIFSTALSLGFLWWILGKVDNSTAIVILFVSMVVFERRVVSGTTSQYQAAAFSTLELKLIAIEAKLGMEPSPSSQEANAGLVRAFLKGSVRGWIQYAIVFTILLIMMATRA